jgi:hypothetical protein
MALLVVGAVFEMAARICALRETIMSGPPDDESMSVMGQHDAAMMQVKSTSMHPISRASPRTAHGRTAPVG